ncbi:hypothetical protein D3C74_426380 [compost metagenome]
MIGRRGGYINRLATQSIHQGGVLPFRVDQDDIVIAGQHLIDNFPFRGKALAGTGYAEDKAVSIHQLLAVGNNHVFADDILSIVNATRMNDFLRPKRNKDSRTFRR